MHTEHFAHPIIVKSLITKMRKRERSIAYHAYVCRTRVRPIPG